MPYSHSRLNTFETCPRQFYHRYIARDVEFKETVHTKTGTALHAAVEHRLKADKNVSTKLEPEFGDTDIEMMYLNAVKVRNQIAARCANHYRQWVELELKYACHDFDFIGYVDWLVQPHERPHSMIIVDWKSGKVRKDFDQLDRYAWLVFENFPKVMRVLGLFAYVKHDVIKTKTYNRSDADIVRMDVLNRVQNIDKLGVTVYDDWRPKTSGLCKAWCDVLSCPHNGKQEAPHNRVGIFDENSIR